MVREEGLGYIDLTGNILLVLSEPGLFVDVAVARARPAREERPARTLKGQKAGRIVRALCDFREPVGVRQLAARAGVDPGYASRLLVLLDRELLIERGARGRVDMVNWRKLLERWAEEAPFQSRGATSTFIDPRGLTGFLTRLSKVNIPYAITGSLAASRFAPVAPARLAAIYVEDLGIASRLLGLREATAGANVMLVAPKDDVVFERSAERGGAVCAAPSQVAADLLTGPGRSPAEAEKLLAWMAANENAWRG